MIQYDTDCTHSVFRAFWGHRDAPGIFSILVYLGEMHGASLGRGPSHGFQSQRYHRVARVVIRSRPVSTYSKDR